MPFTLMDTRVGKVLAMAESIGQFLLYHDDLSRLLSIFFLSLLACGKGVY
jgi:hypothetical protein